MKVELLRLSLPQEAELDDGRVRCAWRGKDGHWHCDAPGSLAELGERYHARRVEACLHPLDVSLAELSLPPLSRGRLRAAVSGALETLALAPVESLAIGFGPQGEDGRLTVAWVEARTLHGVLARLRPHGLAPHAVFPPPAFLPWSEGSPSACEVDGWLWLRTGCNSGLLQALGGQRVNGPGEASAARLATLLPAGQEPRWLTLEAHPTQGDWDALAWSGASWRVRLPMPATGDGRASSWRRAASGWGIAALALWSLGLNLHVGRLEAEGQALKRHMSARLRAAFPDIQVVLNPLQQARQRQQAGGAGAGGFSGLARVAAMLPLAGEVTGLRFSADEQALHVEWRRAAGALRDALPALQAQALEQGVEIVEEAAGKGLRLSYRQADTAAAAQTP
ncbi:hypothetical protein GPA19_04240 [Azoarcus indigens]|uniref:General secretion pathway protein L n=1 Tax=Azoarcus indigens TaxID=29545 RepID=A0A4R6EC82_9RHOO|nr:type II secretion system protein GspL [Azoarcus indigens]NMG64158.1 hypothetical protein [Azoarcus indigens]TDN55753.1 general secretion pathway protein L [Azoarcus indigens]